MDLGMSDVAKISIHAPRMGSDGYLHPTALPEPPISIHAPRMGSDVVAWLNNKATHEISIHAPRMGSDPAKSPARSIRSNDFNPRSPDGERL